MWAGCLEQGYECLKSPHKPGSNVMSQDSGGLIGVKTLALRWLIGKYITGNCRSQVKGKGLARWQVEKPTTDQAQVCRIWWQDLGGSQEGAGGSPDPHQWPPLGAEKRRLSPYSGSTGFQELRSKLSRMAWVRAGCGQLWWAGCVGARATASCSYQSCCGLQTRQEFPKQDRGREVGEPVGWWSGEIHSS